MADPRTIRLWDAEHAPKFGYSLVRRNDGVWSPGSDEWFEVRDLGFDAASDGAMGARHVRAKGTAVEAEWRCNDVGFHYLFVCEGSLGLESNTGDIALEKRDAAYIPPRARHRVASLSDDCELIEFVAPANGGTFAFAGSVPTVVETDENAEIRVTRESPSAYVPHGLRTFLEQRNLGVAEQTDGRLDMLVARPRGPIPNEGTDWHYHTMSEIIVVLEGHLELGIDGYQEPTLVRAGDANCIGAGMRHVAGKQSEDYAVLALRVPAKFDTVPVDSPVPKDGA